FFIEPPTSFGRPEQTRGLIESEEFFVWHDIKPTGLVLRGKIQDARFRIQDPGCRMQDEKKKRRSFHKEKTSPYKTFCVILLASWGSGSNCKLVNHIR